MMVTWRANDLITTFQSKSHVMAELFEWSVVVGGQEIEVLAERRQVGDVIFLEDIAVYPASGASVTVGGSGRPSGRTSRTPRQFEGSGASSLVIRGTRFTGANPGVQWRLRSLSTEEETNEHDS